ncbi:MAG: DegV family protein [Clostridia bacterium]|nr:DegV family protein [Clostridia bacterium]
MKIRICADSTCDLSAELIEKYDIGILPLYVEKDGKYYRDGVDIVPQDIYEYVGSGKGVCHTAACNVDDYTAFFKETLESYDAIVYFNISSEMSSCYQNACVAAGDFENVYVIDSRNLSTGIGLLVLEAADRAAAGVAADEIAKEMQELTAKAEASFVIDTLFYLQKGGRCSALVALGANLLKLKPCIEVKEGTMGVGKKYRGKIEGCIEQYVRERIEGRSDIRKHRVFVTHSGCKPELVAHIKEMVAGYGFEEVLETTAGCTVSNHCGPNTLGVLFIRK